MTVGFERAISFCPLCGEWARGHPSSAEDARGKSKKTFRSFMISSTSAMASARKIDRQALDAGILLWESENIY